MKVLVYGSKGWIGNQVINLLNQLNIEWVEGKSRAEDTESLEQEQ
jgi:dihydrodipicolinate reductase